MKAKRYFFSLFLLVINIQVNAQKADQKYNSKSVQIRCGGFVDGLIYHPTKIGILYYRTDMGGAYKWNDTHKEWDPLLNWVSFKDNNLIGAESIVLDRLRIQIGCTWPVVPMLTQQNPRQFFGLLDRGKTFERTDVPFKMVGNENGKGYSERMVVNPNNGNIIYVGTRVNVLRKSYDRAVSWKQIVCFPSPKTVASDSSVRAGGWYGPKSNGITFVLFDVKHQTSGKTALRYAGIS